MFLNPLFSPKHIWEQSGEFVSLLMFVHMWEQGAPCNPVWLRAFCLISWAHTSGLHAFDSGMGALGGCLKRSGKWRGLRLVRGKKCKVGYWSIGTIWLWLMLCSVCVAVLEQKGSPAKISQTQTSNLFRAGGGGSWLLKLLLFCHYWCFPCEKLQWGSLTDGNKGKGTNKALLQYKHWALTVSLKCLKHM